MNTKTTFTTIGNLIDAFRLHLPPLQGLDPNEPSSHHVLLSHALVEASTIKLYGMYFHLNSIAKDRCLAAAEKIITCGGLDLHAFGYMNPIIGVRTSIYDKYFLILISPIKTLWMIACRVFIEGISSERSNSSPPDNTGNNEEALTEKLQLGIRCLRLFYSQGIPTEFAF